MHAPQAVQDCSAHKATLRHSVLRRHVTTSQPHMPHAHCSAAIDEQLVTIDKHSVVHPGDASGTPAEPPVPADPPRPPDPLAPPEPLVPLVPPLPPPESLMASDALASVDPAAPPIPLTPLAPPAPSAPLAPPAPLPSDPLAAPEPLAPPRPELPPAPLVPAKPPSMHSQVAKAVPSALQVCAPSQPRGPTQRFVSPAAQGGALSVLELDEQCVANAAMNASHRPKPFRRRDRISAPTTLGRIEVRGEQASLQGMLKDPVAIEGIAARS
jgi:hypothetical protein